MKVVHFHLERDEDADPNFVRFVNALAERGVEQKAVIGTDRRWRKALHPLVAVAESSLRPLSADRLLLPIRTRRLAREWRPDAFLAWTHESARFLPKDRSVIRLVRCGTDAGSIKHLANVDILICPTQEIAENARRVGWERRLEIIDDLGSGGRGSALDAPVAPTIVNSYIELMMERP